jgi:plastocyanin
MIHNRAVLLIPAILAACAGSAPTGNNLGGPPGGAGGGGGGTTASVTIMDYAFGPTSLTVKAGTTVTWTNNGPSSHSVTSDAQGGFDSGTLSPPMASMDPYGGTSSGASYQMKFATPGTYTYHCAFHGSMHGTVTVQ